MGSEFDIVWEYFIFQAKRDGLSEFVFPYKGEHYRTDKYENGVWCKPVLIYVYKK